MAGLDSNPYTPSPPSARTSAATTAISGDDATLRAVEERMAAVCGIDERVGQIACEQLRNGGKRIRARVALAASDALGVDVDAAAWWAAAVELLHNATLVHDDVQDGDVTRRGQPTAWALHGVPQAINAGDLMMMAPALAIAEIGADADRDADDASVALKSVQRDLMRALYARAVATVRGQGADLDLRRTLDANGPDAVAPYMRCIEGKTGELFALPVEGACLLAGATPAAAGTRAQPFFHLGVLFQLQDDVLDLFGDKGREARGSDIGEGKISALVVEHLRLYPSDRSWLLAILDKPRKNTTAKDIDDVIDAFNRGGALEAVLARIATLCTLAHHEAEPELKPLVVELVGRVLRPIQHCFQHRGADAAPDVLALLQP